MAGDGTPVPHLRSATPADAPTIAALLTLLAEEEGLSARLDAAGVEAVLTRFARAVLAEAAGVSVGVGLFYPGYDLDTATTGVHLEALVVAPAWRGAGLGRQLMAAVADATRAEGGAWVAWYARAANRRARRFYRQLGAVEERYLNLYLQDAPFAALTAQRLP
ncbi:MAG: GNAT family N-acetyltransferase [Alphaproteobacteria bacterium]|nr:GNAT family N-acetyltransferase [Alphaproteobacteria bacterium]